MEKKVTLKNVADTAGVSKSTVSQFLNGRYTYMSPSTRQKIEEAVKELNYQPNAIARSLKVKQTQTIGIVVANILHHFSTQIIKSIEEYFHEKGYSTIICNADDNPEKEIKYLQTLLAKQVDGFIIFPTSDNKEFYKKLLGDNVPLVFVDRKVEGVDVDVVLLDNLLAARQAVDHLFENGYRSAALLTMSLMDNVTPRIERAYGVKESLQQKGIEVEEHFVAGMDVENMYAHMEVMFSGKNPPEAVITGNDLSLMEFMKFSHSKKLSLGKEIGLVTFDDANLCTIYSPTITAIKQPVEEMGNYAAALLYQRIEKKDPEPPKVHRFAPELMARESSRKVREKIYLKE